jgi:outer membrane immunogenic protein
LLVYGTGGVALQQAFKITAQTSFELNAGSLGAFTIMRDPISSPRNQLGWAAGLGVEWALLNNISLGVEYLRADFGSFEVVYDDHLADERRTVSLDDKVDLARAKLNLRF